MPANRCGCSPCQNIGFGNALNLGIKEARYPFTYLLNNDVRLVPGLHELLLAELRKSDAVFAAYPAQKVIKNGTGTVYAGCTLKFHYGMFRIPQQFGGDFPPQIGPRPSWYASGAVALFAAAKLRQLEGFNPLYAPAYLEDTDLSHRAWQVLAVPTPPVEHWYEATSSRLPARRIAAIKQRNVFLFHWCLLRDRQFWWRHLLWLPVNLLKRSRPVVFTNRMGLWLGAFVYSKRHPLSSQANCNCGDTDLLVRINAPEKPAHGS